MVIVMVITLFKDLEFVFTIVVAVVDVVVLIECKGINILVGVLCGRRIGFCI